MKQLQFYLARIEKIHAREKFRSLVSSIFCVNGLAFQRVLIVFVKKKRGSKSIAHKGILIGENDFNDILSFFEPLPLNMNLLFFENDFFL